MDSTVFALLLFGCSDDGSACQQLAATQPRYYDSLVLCEADVDVALQSDVSLRADYPSVVARCVPIREQAALDRGTVDLRDDRFEPVHSVSR